MKLREYYKSKNAFVKNLPLSLAIYITILLVFGNKIFGIRGGQSLEDAILWVSTITFFTFIVSMSQRLLRLFK